MTTTRPESSSTEPALDDEGVAAYLCEHPDFLERHQDVLAALEIPHRIAGGATSLIERQVAQLRRRNDRLEQRLVELVQTARENERVGARLLALGRGLLEAESLDGALALVREALLTEFAADEVVIRLLDTGDGARAAREPGRFLVSGDEDAAPFAAILEGGEPVCGRLTPEQLAVLFDDRAERLGSAAAVPLRTGRAVGLIGLGSSEPEHFSEDMGTLFLGQLGELVSAGLARHLEAG